MNHLVIFCHPSTASFNRAIADSVEAVSGALGHDTVAATCTESPSTRAVQGGSGRLRGDGPARRRQEQEFIAWADMLTFVYPVWWTGMPAMLKGYIDRVFCQGFAYAWMTARPKDLLAARRC
jgi:NAD(P)H dehydrogenase (quinone)